MSFFHSLFRKAPAPPPPAPAAFSPPPVPLQLPAITAPTAAQLVDTAQPGPAALEVLTPQQSPSGYLGALQEKQLGGDMVKVLAHGMPDREGVFWAAKSAEKVANQLPPVEVAAMQAAQAWARNPTPAAKAAAQMAAGKTELLGPGGMAAQAAAWANPASPSAPRLAPHASGSAVMMAAAIIAFPKLAAPKPTVPTVTVPMLPKLPLADLVVPPPALPAPTAVVPPEVAAQTFQGQYPFIAMGLDIASGKTPIA